MISIYPLFGYQKLNQREKKTYAMEKILTKTKFAFGGYKVILFINYISFSIKNRRKS